MKQTPLPVKRKPSPMATPSKRSKISDAAPISTASTSATSTLQNDATPSPLSTGKLSGCIPQEELTSIMFDIEALQKVSREWFVESNAENELRKTCETSVNNLRNTLESLQPGSLTSDIYLASKVFATVEGCSKTMDFLVKTAIGKIVQDQVSNLWVLDDENVEKAVESIQEALIQDADPLSDFEVKVEDHFKHYVIDSATREFTRCLKERWDKEM